MVDSHGQEWLGCGSTTLFWMIQLMAHARKIDERNSSDDNKADESSVIKPILKSGSSPSTIPIAAIGVSAGGLEPLQQFFDSMSTDTGCAFVIIQHLSPNFRSLMDELLARHSSMNIYRIDDDIEIQPNSIYLNTPRTVITINGNLLHVEKQIQEDKIYLPIDLFFESLATDRGTDALGLVLSGTGSDGTIGCQCIKKAGGKVLVQEPTTTRFENMPCSVISDGSHDLVAAPDALALSVQKLLNNEPLDALVPKHRLPISDPLSDILSMLKHGHTTDFLQYKESTIYRRIERRAHMRGITDISDYRDLLITDANELLDLYADLLIEVTEFFRDSPAFEILQIAVLPELTKDLKDDSKLRVWVPGCASGEEAYSIAILFQEQARSMGIHINLKIMATDIHARSMNQASSGIYDESALANISTELVVRYFDCAEGQAQVKSSLRNMVFFSSHDVTRDPPFTRIDLVSCRNLLIYLKEEAQEKVMNRLHFSLRKDGHLFLGPSEHIGRIAHEFDTVNEKWRIFKKRRDIKLLTSESILKSANIRSVIGLNHGVQRTVNKSQIASNDETIAFKRAHRTALESIVTRHAPPGFLLTEDGTVVHVFGNASELISIQAGSFSKRIIDLINPDLKTVVAAALDSSRSRTFNGFTRTAYAKNEKQTSICYLVSLTSLEVAGEPQNFLLLSITDSTAVERESLAPPTSEGEYNSTNEAPDSLKQRISTLELNLQSSEASLQSTIEQLEASNEELQSTNEELMSANEEMQSTNEELHSVNEELYTVSAEHQRKNDELVEKETDILMLLQSSKIGTVHFDENLCLRRYTANALRVFNILPQDIGRPANHITLRNNEKSILGLVYKAYQESENHEVHVAVENHSYLLRIMPYNKNTDKSNGVLVTVIDITDVESVRSELAELSLQYHDIIQSTDNFVVRWDARTNAILYCNEPYAQRWNKSVEELTGADIMKLRSKSGAAELSQRLATHPPNETRSGVYPATFSDEETSYVNVHTRSISNDGLSTDVFQSTGFDCTDEYKYRAALEQLFDVFANDDLEFQSKLEDILKIGLDYYSLDTAIVSMVLGETYEISSVVGENPKAFVAGTQLKLQDTVCSTLIDSDNSIAVHDLSNSDLNGLPCHHSSGIECFIGAPVNTPQGPYGTVSFSAQQPRNDLFSNHQEHFCKMIGSWVGLLIGNHEQIEFMGDQSEYYNSIFLTVPTMMFLCDPDGLVLSASNRLCDKLELEPDSVPGKTCYQLLNVNETASLKNAVTEGAAHSLPLSFELQNGSLMEVELNCTIKPVGTLQGVRMMVLNDVSERNAVLRQSEDQNQRLHTANENLNQFAFIASHDLQEPLRKIQQFSNFLEEDLQDKLSGDAKYHLDVIVNASERMSTLIYDLLRYSGASQEEPESEDVSLNDLLKEVQQELELSISETHAQLKISQLPNVTGDKGLLRQLFVNLISNSMKYCAKDRTPLIVVNSFCTPVQEGVEISDNGIGFEMSFAQKIFEPFNRLHNNDQYKGNGIGLAICSKVCEKHGWTLTAESQPDVGSKFIINFNKQNTQ